MTPQSRRVFLGSAVAAAAGSGALLMLPKEGFAQDDFGTALDREMLAAVRLMARNQTGEGPRRVAGILRLMALHHAPKDAGFRAALRAKVQREGREALLQRTMDPIELEANARTFGFRFVITPPNPPRAVREKVLNEFLAHGLTPFRRLAADGFDKASGDLDRRAGAIRPIIDHNEPCRMQEMLYDTYTAGAAMTCAVLPGSPACFGITAAAITQLALLYYYGCR